MTSKGKLNENRITALILILGSSLCFSAMTALAHEAGQTLPAGEVVFFRVFFTLIVLIPYLLRSGSPFFGKSWRLVLVRGTAGFLSLCLGFFALTKIPIAEVSVLWKSSIVFTALLSIFILKESPTLKLLIWSAVSFIGAALILKPSLQIINIGGLAAFCAGFFVGVVSVSIRKLHQSEHSDTIVFGFCFWGSLLGLIMFGNTFILPDFRESMLLVSIGICGTIGQMLFTHAFRFAPAYVIQPCSFIEVLFTAISGIIIFNQIPDWISVIGALAIVIAGIGIVKEKISIKY